MDPLNLTIWKVYADVWGENRTAGSFSVIDEVEEVEFSLCRELNEPRDTPILVTLKFGSDVIYGIEPSLYPVDVEVDDLRMTLSATRLIADIPPEYQAYFRRSEIHGRICCEITNSRNIEAGLGLIFDGKTGLNLNLLPK